MDVILIGLAACTLLYALAVLGLALSLRNKPRPYPVAWCQRYLHTVERMRSSLWFVVIILGVHAVLFLLPTLVGKAAQQSTAALFGGIDLLCALVLYGLWKWTACLIRTVLTHVRVTQDNQP